MTGATSTPSVVTFGELLLRLDAPGGDRLVQADRLEVRYTGAEANVAASLSGFGLRAEVVSALPAGALGQACLAYLGRFGVGTEHVRRAAGRIGLLFHEAGGVGRPPVVVYDRAGSVFARTDPADYDWPSILAGHDWLHLSGTAPALGEHVAAAVDRAVGTARDLGVGVSLDLNYRASLWSLEAAGRALRPLAERADLVLGVGAEAAAMFGVATTHPAAREAVGKSAGEAVGKSAGEAVGEAAELAELIRGELDVPLVAGTSRNRRADGTVDLTGLLARRGSGVVVSGGYPVIDPVGRMGTGDAFAAGVLRGVLTSRPDSEIVEFAIAAAHLKQSIRGDVNLVTVAEVEAAMRGQDDTRIRR